ncbi:TetR/AcrR family transcriptional regulator [Microbacterium sp. NC79]|uniref:TetR/AcrR family transcriptional regulator n=1 Tax=Microbacterium sp. NC79 TaxID=2851009 RepID=UPI001C2C7237|nr:TetR/AcrR family transcriptional regulator [Microbacterium sp. NC79]MBV0894617.1 TetR/AcrR family transcriptional regulator [Microbacterium sp. NC79]
MSRPPLAREKVLDAFEHVLLVEGERAATMDRVAAEAGVSKGGLLYHFASKIALEEALIERMDHLVALDMDEMLADPSGVAAAFIRSSAQTGDELDRAITAVGRLASNGSALSVEAIRRLRVTWHDALKPFVESEVGLELILLVSDGVYFNNALTIGSVPEIADMEALITMVTTAAGVQSPAA